MTWHRVSFYVDVDEMGEQARWQAGADLFRDAVGGSAVDDLCVTVPQEPVQRPDPSMPTFYPSVGVGMMAFLVVVLVVLVFGLVLR